MPANVRLRLATTDSLLRNFPAFPVDASPKMFFPVQQDPFWNRLRHELSWALPEAPTLDKDWSRRTAGEIAALRRHENALRFCLATGKEAVFKGVVSDLASVAFGRRLDYRASDMATTMPSHGGTVVFLSAEEAQLALARVLDLLVWQRYPSTVLRATVAMAMITNAHALPNGNGRLSRIIFNHVLFSYTSDDAYVPLREYAAQARGGFHIRLREAEIHGRWDGFIDFICTMIEHWASALAYRVPD
ncbi:Fic family protein [Luteibacter rhizovicinus]|uniref:Fic family protein n=1 Tax=Luteibacter rhizovicinus TaxID=242606 RepID=UPI00104730E5|nr:Fic family protein [Luteibacter rhizovicinus]